MSQIPVTDHLIALNKYILPIHMDWLVNIYHDYHCSDETLKKCKAFAHDLLSTFTQAQEESIGKTAREYSQILNAEVLRDSEKASFLYNNPISLFYDLVSKALNDEEEDPTYEEFEMAWKAMKIAFPEFMEEYHEKKKEQHPHQDEVTFWLVFLKEFAQSQEFYALCQKHFVPFLEKHEMPTETDDSWDLYDFDEEKTQKQENLDFLVHLRNSIQDKVDWNPQIQNEEYKREVQEEIDRLDPSDSERPLQLAQKTFDCVREHFQSHQPNVDEKRLLADIFRQFPDFPDLSENPEKSPKDAYKDTILERLQNMMQSFSRPQTFDNLPSLIYDILHYTSHPDFIVSAIDQAEEELPGLKGIIYGGLYEKFGKNHQDAQNPNWGPDHIGEYLDQLDAFLPEIVGALKPRLAELKALEGPKGLYAKVHAYETARDPDFETDNPNWGEENAFSDLDRLHAALQVVNTDKSPHVMASTSSDSESDIEYGDFLPQEACGVLCEMIDMIKNQPNTVPPTAHQDIAHFLNVADDYLPGLKGEVYGTLYANFGEGSDDPEWGPNNLSQYLDQLPLIFPGILEELLRPRLSEKGLLEGENGLYRFVYDAQIVREPGFKTENTKWGQENAFVHLDVLAEFLKYVNHGNSEVF